MPLPDGPSTAKPKPKPFKPPRPTSSTAQPSVARGGISSSSSNRAQPSSSTSRPRGSAAEADVEDEVDPNADGRQASIPAALLTRLLHEFFSDDRVRISKSADRAVGKYMETFVREAIARAAVERVKERERMSRGEGFLEVEDLEKLAPQLILDF